MNEKLEKIKEYIKSNPVVAIGAGLVVLLLFLPKLFRTVRRRRIRRNYRPLQAVRRRTTARRQYTKGGKAKKAWQIKGSLAAKRHMARIRKMR